MPYTPDVFCFVETRLFARLVAEYLSDEDYASLQSVLIRNPEAGAVIPGSGGIRKLRWAGSGRGKQGGYRVIYYLRRAEGQIWMLTVYPKNMTDNIPSHVLRRIREELEHD
jgi:mRNA-degrading endonuclease RelE of RelBE toxin-antitoxin system